MRRYWLMKCEPAAYTIDDLARDGRTSWEGVRNYQARNFMRDDMQVGDGVLFYASNADPSGVTGLAEIARAGYPDPVRCEEGAQVLRRGQRRQAARLVHGGHRVRGALSRDGVARHVEETRGLEEMVVTKKGSRLSVQPVTKSEYDIVVRLGRKKARAGRSRECASVTLSPACPSSSTSLHRSVSPSSSKASMNRRLPAALARRVRRTFRQIVGRWQVSVRPVDRGRWRLELSGASGRHLWLFAAPVTSLPDMVVEKLEEFIRCSAADAPSRRRLAPQSLPCSRSRCSFSSASYRVRPRRRRKIDR